MLEERKKQNLSSDSSKLGIGNIHAEGLLIKAQMLLSYPLTFYVILRHDPDIQVVEIDLLKEYSGNNERVCLTCRKAEPFNVTLKVRNGSQIVLRNIDGKVPDEMIRTAVIERRVLYSIGRDSRKTLATACARHCGEIKTAETQRKAIVR